jgi:tetratricopeptide (TPR) repeat protein
MDYATRLAETGNIASAVVAIERALVLDPSLAVHPETEANRVYATVLVGQARALADQGNILSAAVMFRKALTLDPTLAIDPDDEAKRIYAPRVEAKARALAGEGKLEEALAMFREAIRLDPSLDIYPELATQVEYGLGLVMYSRYAEAMVALEATLRISATLDVTSTVPAWDWNSICRGGSLDGNAAGVLAACERAVAAAPEDGDYRSSRGLARALTGDILGAIADFEFAVAWAETDPWKADFVATLKVWITALKDGMNPFDQATLDALR